MSTTGEVGAAEVPRRTDGCVRGAPNGLLAEVIERLPLPVLFHLGNERVCLNAAARSLWPDAAAKLSELPVHFDGNTRTLLEFCSVGAPRSPAAEERTNDDRRIRVPGGKSYDAITFPRKNVNGPQEWQATILQPAVRDVNESRLLTDKLGHLKAIVHEFRNTLTAAREALAFLNEGVVGELNPEQHRFLNSAMEDLEALGRTLVDLTSLWVTQAGVLQMMPRRVDVRHLLEQLSLSAVPVGNKCRISMQLDIGHSPLLLTADQNLLVQALRNVLANAIRHTPIEGSVRIRAFAENEVRSEMLDKSGVSRTGRSTEPGDEEAVVIEIADTGPGVSPIDEERIFQPFERGTTDELNSTHAHSGMGLGLSIARDIATRHGGTLEVLRTEGERSCFRFRFPKTETQAQSWMIRATQQAIKDVRPLMLPLGCVLLQLRAGQHGQEDRVYPDPLSAIQLVATQNLRPTDTVLAIEGRLLLLVPACTRSAAHAMIDRVLGYTRESARTFRGPFGEEGVAYGVSAYPEDGETAEAILGRAEAEMSARV